MWTKEEESIALLEGVVDSFLNDPTFEGADAAHLALSELAMQRGQFYGDNFVVPDDDPAALKLFNDLNSEQGPTQIVNQFWCWSRRQHVVIFINDDGKRKFSATSFDLHKTKLVANTTKLSHFWSLSAELTAQQSLQRLVPYVQYKQYMLTGMLTYISEKSNVIYVLRKGRPTIAIGQNGEVLAALCTHAVDFYVGSYGGYLCPTDDIIAEYLLLVSDEHRYWKKATQHNPKEPEADLL